MTDEPSVKQPSTWKTLLVALVGWVVLACARGGIPPSWQKMSITLVVVVVALFVAAARTELYERASKNAQKRPPNTRMQRTRSSPSALRSPLMRCPLGSTKRQPCVRAS